MSRLRHTVQYALVVMIVIVAALTFAGCSSDPDGGPVDTTGSVTTLSTVATTAPETSSTTLPPLELSDYDKELARTANVQRALSAYLAAERAGQDDPRIAIIYGLRARTQAITGRQALDKGDLELADTAMRDVYSTINVGRSIATDTTADILSASYATIDTLGIPSQDPDRAAESLDAFIDALAPLLDEASALIPSTETT